MPATLYQRQKVLMRLMHLAGGGIERLRLAKLAFLFREETHPAGFYGFLPFRFGPYSFQLFKEIERLADWSYVIVEKNTVTLTELGSAAAKAISHRSIEEIDRVHERYAALSTTHLVDHVYGAHPWYALNSERRYKPDVHRPLAECAAYTCGYEGLRIDDFLNLLLEQGIRRILDVRSNPISMQFGFHKKTLARLAASVDISYSHYPDLGIPSALRRSLETQNDYEILFQHYRSEILKHETSSQEEVASILATEPSVMLCMEADPVRCHRTSLAKSVAQIAKLPVQDLRLEQSAKN